ncbi:MAG: hypothetical protein HETSPECPRED_004556 [Heterodermia speciosa]|uniref:Uncharacterized protein n=1 Tax=Heterodermia speciosa TaxID=116794 RepID=A0A8H3FDA7_9LECA|nr:MAG: hypothetical protein HETSPECPRED_004556 [Heterodermia speciosa]
MKLQAPLLLLLIPLLAAANPLAAPEPLPEPLAEPAPPARARRRSPRRTGSPPRQSIPHLRSDGLQRQIPQMPLDRQQEMSRRGRVRRQRHEGVV